jgi:hypothetical protein
MRRLNLSHALSCAAAAFASSAFAGAGVLNTVVEPLSPNVTYSIPGATSPPALVTYVGYSVSISNAGGNTINHIRFTGTTAVTDGAEVAEFDSAEGATCETTNAAKTAISCTIGQLSGGSAFPTFAVFFKAPAKVTNGVADAAGSDVVSYSGLVYYGEGTGGPNSVPDNSIRNWSATAVTLGTANAVLVKSGVPKSGGTFYTGSGGAATAADPLTTIVKVPGRSTYTTAEVFESSIAQSCSPNPAYCLSTELTIPRQGLDFAFLEITLRRDASTIVKGAKIANAELFYAPDGSPPGVLGVPILACNADGTIPSGQRRCIFSRQEFTKKTAPTPAFEGDWEFVVRAFENGRFAW